MDLADRWAYFISILLTILYTGNSLCLAACELSNNNVIVFWMLNSVQSLCYISIAMIMRDFYTKHNLSQKRYLALTAFCSLFFAFWAVPLQYRFIYDFVQEEHVGLLMKIYTCLIFVFNWLQFLILGLAMLIFIHRLFFNTVKNDTYMASLVLTKWYYIRLNHLKHLCQIFPSKAGIRYLIDVYLPSLQPMIIGELYCEPIVMAYIFAVCTWVIPADDTVWIRETCEICSSDYMPTETILVNHEGQHLHEYCARRWFPSLITRTIYREGSESIDMFAVAKFARWIDELPRLLSERNSDPNRLLVPVTSA